MYNVPMSQRSVPSDKHSIRDTHNQSAVMCWYCASTFTLELEHLETEAKRGCHAAESVSVLLGVQGKKCELYHVANKQQLPASCMAFLINGAKKHLDRFEKTLTRVLFFLPGPVADGEFSLAIIISSRAFFKTESPKYPIVWSNVTSANKAAMANSASSGWDRQLYCSGASFIFLQVSHCYITAMGWATCVATSAGSFCDRHSSLANQRSLTSKCCRRATKNCIWLVHVHLSAQDSD